MPTNPKEKMVADMETLNLLVMIYYLIGFAVSGLFIAYEMYRAPLMDDNGRTIKPGKKLKDLWRKK